MFCPNCGTKNEDDALFCGNCGTRLVIDVPQETPVQESVEEEPEVTPVQQSVPVQPQQAFGQQPVQPVYRSEFWSAACQ